jgi:hypothetical protein
MTRPEHCETLELCEGCYEAVTRVGSLCVVCAENEAREMRRAEEVAALRDRAEAAESKAEAATKAIGRAIALLVDAGYPGGDRETMLGNIECLISDRNAAEYRNQRAAMIEALAWRVLNAGDDDSRERLRAVLTRMEAKR